MHEGGVHTDVPLVRSLLETQFPQWADFFLERVQSAGTDNALYRLGDDKVVRLPRIDWVVGQMDKEQYWLPRLAPNLPLAIPEPLAKGKPDESYPWEWSVYKWLEGQNLTIEEFADPQQAAIDLGQFILALQKIDATDGPPPGQYNSFRGVPLAMRDTLTTEAIGALQDTIDTETVKAVWETALEVPEWQEPQVWIHGDLQSGNFLIVDGQLSAVIDFGCLGVGDPACDVMAAWMFLDGDTRPVFREVLQVDEATSLRGRGWVLSAGLIALPYYQSSNPMLAEIARRAIDEAIADFESSRESI
jgi:aminoglycoside phosphotransferase (APT) family kinase protein